MKIKENIDVKILDLALKAVTIEFDRFIACCMDENGDPKAPAKKELMIARSLMPKKYKTTLTK